MDDTLGPIGLNRVTVPDEGGEGAGGGGANSSGAVGWLGGVLGAASGGTSGGPKGGKPSGKSVMLDVEGDAFWMAHAGDEFPVASEAAASEISRLKQSEVAIRSAAGVGGAAGDSSGSDAAALQHQQALAAAGLPSEVSGGGAELGSAIDSLPALLRHKAVLNTHSTLLTAIMSAVMKRSLPDFSELQPPNRSPMDKNSVLAVLSEPGKGSLDDKGRLACVHLLTCPGSSGDEAGGGGMVASIEAEFNDCVNALRLGVMGGGGNNSTVNSASVGNAPQPSLSPTVQSDLDRALAALSYCKFLRCVPGACGLGCHAHTSSQNFSGDSGGSGGAVGNLLGGMARAALRGINAATRLMTGDTTRPPVVRITAAVCEGNSKIAGPLLAPLMEALEVRDPRLGGSQKWTAYLAGAIAAANAAVGGTAPASGLAIAGAHFRNACVFITGGGSYLEYGELLKYANEGKESGTTAGGSPLVSRTILYGSTEMTSPSGFLAQLAELGTPHVK